jgi:hypothetical protein
LEKRKISCLCRNSNPDSPSPQPSHHTDRANTNKNEIPTPLILVQNFLNMFHVYPFDWHVFSYGLGGTEGQTVPPDFAAILYTICLSCMATRRFVSSIFSCMDGLLAYLPTLHQMNLFEYSQDLNINVE